DELVDDALCDVGDREASSLGGELRLEDDLQQEIAELVTERRGLAVLDGLEDLVDLLEQIGSQALRCLLAVPRAPLRATQARHDVDEAAEGLRDARVRHRATVSARPEAVNAQLLPVRRYASSLLDVARVELYGTRSCAFCMRAKRLLEARGIPFAEFELDGDAEL